MAAAKTYRPEQLATALGISGKVVRAHLRRTYKRPETAKGSTWVLSQKQATETLKHFRAKNPQATPKKPAAKAKAPTKA